MNSSGVVIESHESFMDKVRKRASRLLPCTQWVSEQTPKSVAFDTLAGATSALIMIPQSLSYANMLRVPLQHGLYTSMFCGIPYSQFGTSRDIAIGPSAVQSLVIAGTVAHMNPTDALQWISATAILAGMMQLILGLFNLGAMVSLLSHSVITGFCTGAAIVVFFTQILAWFRIPRASDFIGACKSIYNNIGDTSKYDFTIGCSVFVFLIALQFASKRFTNPKLKVLFACRNVFVILVSMLIGFIFYKENGKTPFAVVGNVPSGMPSAHWPSVDWKKDYKQLFLDAFILCICSFVEEISLCFTYARIRARRIAEAKPGDDTPAPPRRVSANQELVAFGIANIVSGLFRGFGITGSMARTAVQHACNVQSPFANLWSFVLTVVAVLCMTEPLKYIPSATLSSVIMAGVLSVVNFQSIINDIKLGKEGYADAFVNAFTAIACLGLGVETGLMCGILVHLAWMVYKQADPLVCTSKVFLKSKYSQSGTNAKSIGQQITVDIIGSIHYICAARLAAKVRKVNELYKSQPCMVCSTSCDDSDVISDSSSISMQHARLDAEVVEDQSGLSVPSLMDSQTAEEHTNVNITFMDSGDNNVHQLELKTKTELNAHLYSPYLAIVFDLSKTFQLDVSGLHALAECCEALRLNPPSCHPMAISVHFVVSMPVSKWFIKASALESFDFGNTIFAKHLHIHRTMDQATRIIGLEADITIRLLESRDLSHLFTKQQELATEQKKQQLVKLLAVNSEESSPESMSLTQVQRILASYLYQCRLDLDSDEEAVAWMAQNKI